MLDKRVMKLKPVFVAKQFNVNSLASIQLATEGRFIHLRVSWALSVCNGIIWGATLLWQCDVSRSMESQHETPADHVPCMTIGLPPSPRLAEFDGELSATQIGVCINQPLDFIKVARVVIVATESKCRFHADDVIIGMWNASPNQKIAELLHKKDVWVYPLTKRAIEALNP